MAEIAKESFVFVLISEEIKAIYRQHDANSKKQSDIITPILRRYSIRGEASGITPDSQQFWNS